MHHRVGERGATLLDAVVGTALMLIVFTGIASAFQLAVYAVGANKSRAGAIALANERLEYIRSLPYDTIGTLGGIPAGTIAQEEAIHINDTNYTRRTFISYEDDPADGLGVADSNNIPTDYRAAKVTISWDTRQGTRSIVMSTRVSPPGVETSVPGGTLSIQVTNDADEPVVNAPVSIENTDVSPAIDITTYTGPDGFATMLGAPPGAGYRISVTKPGYTTSQTYSPTAQNTNPIPAHLAVALNQTTAATFEIDVFSTLTVQTFEPVEAVEWIDSFPDASQLSSVEDVLVGGELTLEIEEGVYAAVGTARSAALAPQYLAGWNEASWEDVAPPGTSIRYFIYSDAGTLIPDADLPGNGAGFVTSPVDLTSLSPETYPSLQVGAELSGDTSATPSIASWRIAYDAGPTPLPDISFSVRGAKTIGSGTGGPVYKYDAQLSSGASASTTLTNIEYDSYTLSLDPSDGYDIASACPSPPIALAPGAATSAQLSVVPHTTHSLFVDVRAAGGAAVAGASVRLSRGAYDTTIETDACGNAFFPGLSSGSAGGGNPYTILITAPGHADHSASDVGVSGTTHLPVILN